MDRKTILALLFAAALPTMAAAQARPAALLSSAVGDGLVLPEPGTIVTPGLPARSFERSAAPAGTAVAQDGQRPSLLQHIALGALAGFVTGSAAMIMTDGEYYAGFAGFTAVLGALGGVLIWNIRVM